MHLYTNSMCSAKIFGAEAKVGLLTLPNKGMHTVVACALHTVQCTDKYLKHGRVYTLTLPELQPTVAHAPFNPCSSSTLLACQTL